MLALLNYFGKEDANTMEAQSIISDFTTLHKKFVQREDVTDNPFDYVFLDIEDVNTFLGINIKAINPQKVGAIFNDYGYRFKVWKEIIEDLLNWVDVRNKKSNYMIRFDSNFFTKPLERKEHQKNFEKLFVNTIIYKAKARSEHVNHLLSELNGTADGKLKERQKAAFATCTTS